MDEGGAVKHLLVGDIFRVAAAAVGERTAVAAGRDRVDFAELDARSEELADQLVVDHELGDRVIVWTASAVEAAIVFAACAKAGLVFCPYNPAATADEARQAFAVARPSLIAADRAQLPLAEELTSTERVEEIGELLADAAPPSGRAAARLIDERDAQLMVFTSGSTGAPKAAVVSHRAQVMRSHPGSQFEPRGFAVCVFPLFHVAPWLIALQQWHARDGVAFTVDTAPATIAAALELHEATRLNMIPALWRRILDHVADEDPAASPLRFLRFADTGTSATPHALLAAIREAAPGADVRVFYGSTEAGNVLGLEHADIDRKPGSVGVPSVSVEARLDARGELLVRSPLLFDGYFEAPEETEAVFVDGWFRTGDLAAIDADGYFSIVGRAKDVIRTGGETVSPAEVEAVLRLADGVSDVAVVGVPHPDWGEVVCAAVVADGPRPPTLDDLQAVCADRLAPFKQPRRLEFFDAIPRTATTGQIQRPLLVEAIAGRAA